MDLMDTHRRIESHPTVKVGTHIIVVCVDCNRAFRYGKDVVLDFPCECGKKKLTAMPQPKKRIQVTLAEEAIGHTILYLSGSSYRGEHYILRNLPRLRHVGILLSYADLERRGCTWQRLLDLRHTEQSIKEIRK